MEFLLETEGLSIFKIRKSREMRRVRKTVAFDIKEFA
jgi:hypothetical protein